MLNLKAINERSLFLANTSKANDKAIADHCIIIAEHIQAHGDVTAADVLCNAFGGKKSTGIRVNAIRDWFCQYGGCSWNEEAKKFGKRRAGTFTFNRTEAVVHPWYTCRPEPEFRAFILEKFLLKAIAKANAALEDVEHADQHKVDKALLNALIAITERSKDEAAKQETQSEAPAPEGQNEVLSAPHGWTEIEGGASATGGEIIPELAPVEAVVAASVKAPAKRKAATTH